MRKILQIKYISTLTSLFKCMIIKLFARNFHFVSNYTLKPTWYWSNGSNATCLHITHWKPLWKYNKIASCNFFICKLCYCFQIYKLFLQETDGTYQPRTRQFIFIFEKTRQFNLFVRRHRFKYMHFQTF